MATIRPYLVANRESVTDRQKRPSKTRNTKEFVTVQYCTVLYHTQGA